MLRQILLATVLSAAPLAGAATVTDIHRLLDELHYTIDQNEPTPQDLLTLERSLRADLDFLRNTGPRLMCLKSANGRFYPSQPDGRIVGDTAYDAGHPQLEDCRLTLPTKASGLVCFKRTNGRYYPTDPKTGNIVGATAYDAGHPALATCQDSIN